MGGTPVTEEEFARKYLAMRDGERLLDECSGLESEIDGKDGRPKFDKDDILEYMQQTGIKKPLAAYKDKFETELKKWETDQLTKSKPRDEYTQGAGTGEKQPREQRPKNADELARAVAESMFGPQE